MLQPQCSLQAELLHRGVGGSALVVCMLLCLLSGKACLPAYMHVGASACLRSRHKHPTCVCIRFTLVQRGPHPGTGRVLVPAAQPEYKLQRRKDFRGGQGVADAQGVLNMLVTLMENVLQEGTSPCWSLSESAGVTPSTPGTGGDMCFRPGSSSEQDVR